ncbi:MAG: hypothetical protein BYD32DRAFT_434767 [Podila humilis]|nr:MAG: hypothetical protein BYD32DRAFT_434767 [Podila humilis]
MKHHSLLITLALFLTLFTTLSLADTWKDKNLDNWENGWEVNIFGEPIDSSTGCNSNPCPKRKLSKLRNPITKKTNLCTSPTGEKFLCNDLSHYTIVNKHPDCTIINNKPKDVTIDPNHSWCADFLD